MVKWQAALLKTMTAEWETLSCLTRFLSQVKVRAAPLKYLLYFKWSIHISYTNLRFHLTDVHYPVKVPIVHHVPIEIEKHTPIHVSIIRYRQRPATIPLLISCGAWMSFYAMAYLQGTFRTNSPFNILCWTKYTLFGLLAKSLTCSKWTPS